jgi:small subunit ribosomal protein S19
MARSVWKGPFVDASLLKKVEEVHASKKSVVIKTTSRRSTILPNFVGLIFSVYNGKVYLPVQVSEVMVGHKLGEYSPTRTFRGHGTNRKASAA